MDFSPKPTENQSGLVNRGGVHSERVTGLLSIIVPAYNAKDTIEECIESIVANETDYLYEVIIIDDGSTDNSNVVLDGFCEKYKQISVIHQDNMGFSGARNTGIENAKGEFIMFVDSDDVLPPDAINSLMREITDSQFPIVEGGFYRFPPRKENKENYGIIDARCLRGQPWGKVFRTEVFKDVRFPVGYWYEDTIFAYLMYPYIGQVKRIQTSVYGYRINPNGITFQGRKSNKCIDAYWIVEDMLFTMKLIGFQVSQDTYDQTLLQFGRLLYSRTMYVPEDIRQCVFVMACGLIDSEFSGYTTTLKNIYWRGVEKALRNCDYHLWKVSCFMLL